jgi:6-pyruvoyl-tetrahydropterin synthase
MKGPVEEKTGMVYNIADLKRDLGKILDTLDHKNLDLDVEFFRYYRNTLLKNR